MYYIKVNVSVLTTIRICCGDKACDTKKKKKKKIAFFSLT
jgi:hypothetical protein